MQTFMPHDTYAESAQALDPKRRRNQRNECKVIVKTLLGMYPPREDGRPGGWPHHPAVLQWRGYEHALCRYALDVCRACIGAGDVNGDLSGFFLHTAAELPDTGRPPWMGRADYHLSHRSNLIRKDPDYYRPLWPDVPPDLPYVWPSKETP